MSTRFIHRALQNTLHRWPAKLVLLGYVWMCCGGTLPAPLLMSSEIANSVAGKDRSVPFPCMDKPCGCRNAAQCYKSCCCSTKAERIAWAKEHAVSAQYIALANEAEEPAEQKPRSCCAKQSSKSCCPAQPKTPDCCNIQQTKTTSGTCCKKTVSAESESAPTQAHGSKNPLGLSLLAALKCQGISTTWLGVPLSVPYEHSEWNLTLIVVEYVMIAETFYAAHSDVPATPPPNGILA